MTAENKYEKYGKIYEEFRQLAMELKVPIITHIKEGPPRQYYVPYEPPGDLIPYDYVFLLK